MIKDNQYTLYWERYQSPCGALLLAATASALMVADWVVNDNSGEPRDSSTRNLRGLFRAKPFIMEENQSSPILAQATMQLDEYFSGVRQVFSVPLELAGTEFQRRVWAELLTIPYGYTQSYGTVAKRIGSPRAVRGVAAAIGANRLSVFIPCHRVIGADGSLTGYAGGLSAKRYLLDHESGGSY